MKKVNNYFSHDFNARNDIKLKKVNMQLGMAGIGLYWCIIEYLYENDGYLTLDEDIKLLSYELRVDEELIINLIENFDLFKKQKNKFYSPSVLKRLEKISDKANKNRENILKRWKKSKEIKGNESDTNELPKVYESDTTVLQTNYYIKENKRKENKNNINNIITTTDSNIYSFIEENFGRTLSPLEAEKIGQLLLEFKEDVLKHAISIAVMNQKRTFAYVEGILKNWKGKGFTSLEEIKEDENKTHHQQEPTSIDSAQQEMLDYNWFAVSDEDE